MWYESAPSSKMIDGELVQAVPPSAEDLVKWFDDYKINKQLQDEVWHRFILTRRNFKTMKSWASKQFFFRNATASQLKVFEI